MANQQLTDVMRSYSNQTIESGKKLKDLNQNLYEELSQKQADLVKAYVEMGTQQALTLGKIYGFGNLILAQQEAASQFSQRWLNTAQEAANIWYSMHNKWWSLVEESADYTQAAAEQVLEASKELASETMEAANNPNDRDHGEGQKSATTSKNTNHQQASTDKDKASKPIPKAA